MMVWLLVDEITWPLLLTLDISEVESDLSVTVVDCDVVVAVFWVVFAFSLDCCFAPNAPDCAALGEVALPL